MHTLHDGLIIILFELDRAKVFIPISQLRDISDDKWVMFGWEVVSNICSEDGDNQSGHTGLKEKEAEIHQPRETLLSSDSVWKSYVLALTRHLMRNCLWTCQFQRGFCVFKDKGSMTETPSWFSVLISLRSLCFNDSSLFTHLMNQRASFTKEAAGEQSWDSDPGFLTHVGEVLAVHWEWGPALIAQFWDYCVP